MWELTSDDKEYVDGFVWELTFAPRLRKRLICDETPNAEVPHQLNLWLEKYATGVEGLLMKDKLTIFCGN